MTPLTQADNRASGRLPAVAVLCPGLVCLTLLAPLSASSATSASPSTVPLRLQQAGWSLELSPRGAVQSLTQDTRGWAASDPGTLPAGEISLGQTTSPFGSPIHSESSTNGVHFVFTASQNPAVHVELQIRLRPLGQALVLERDVLVRGDRKLPADLTVRLALGPWQLPTNTWLPLRNGLGQILDTNSAALYRFAGSAPPGGLPLALPLATWLQPSPASRLTLLTDPTFSTRFNRNSIEWTYPQAIGLEDAVERRSVSLVIQPGLGTPDDALDLFYRVALPDLEPGPAWLRDIALVGYDYLSDAGRGWFRDIDALAANLPEPDHPQVLLCLHGWYDHVGRYTFDPTSKTLAPEWTAFTNYAKVKGSRFMTNAQGRALQVGFTNQVPVALSQEKLRARLRYARARNFRVALYFADGLNACDGLPGFSPDRVLYWGGWEGPDTLGRTYCQNPLHPAVRAFYLDYLDALLNEFGPDLDALVWDETFHVPPDSLGAEARRGYAGRAMMRLTRELTRRVQDYNRRTRRAIAFLTSDCLGPEGGAPYALMAHGTYQDSHCRPEAWSYAIFPNYRNVVWSCNWWMTTTWDYVEFGARHYQAPVAISNGWGDDLGFADLSPDQRRHVLRLLDTRKRTPTRLRWFTELPSYPPTPVAPPLQQNP